MKPKAKKVAIANAATTISTVDTTVRKMLDAIDRFLVQPENRRNGASRQLWLILSALRGPDSSNDRIKDQITVPIRRAALPRLADDLDAQYAVGAVLRRNDDVKYAPNRVDASEHFMSHAAAAFDRLGLDWGDRK